MTSHPFTPIRRFFFRMDSSNPKSALGKRSRASDVTSATNHGSYLAPPPQPIFAPTWRMNQIPGTTGDICLSSAMLQNRSMERARLALQQEDESIEAIIVTTLPSYPFCCHEDLLTMSRNQLLEVANRLNSRLSSASQIPCSCEVSTAQIRHSIELLVGIVPEMPGAPKPSRSRPSPPTAANNGPGDLNMLPASPTRRSGKRANRGRQEKGFPTMSTPLRMLERLEEEDEDFFKMQAPLKRRKLLAAGCE